MLRLPIVPGNLGQTSDLQRSLMFNRARTAAGLVIPSLDPGMHLVAVQAIVSLAAWLEGLVALLPVVPAILEVANLAQHRWRLRRIGLVVICLEIKDLVVLLYAA